MPLPKVLTSIEEVAAIPAADLPLMVLSSSSRSFIAWAIRFRTGGHYSHFMWMHRPGFFASQDWWYREVPVKNYNGVRLKFWHRPTMSLDKKDLLLARIKSDLSKPKISTRYDLLNIVGQLFGLKKLHVPWTRICSEHAEILKLVDPFYDLCNPHPEEVNNWLKARPRYACYGRYIPD